jgi:ABC-type phosphonate transport system ATPase subunit
MIQYIIARDLYVSGQAVIFMDDPTGGDEINDMRRASDVLRAALKGT